MSRKLRLPFLRFAAIAAVAAGARLYAESPPDAPPPNIVLIISDDQGWTDYGFAGHPHIRTPNIDRLAASGLTFLRGYVPTSLCRPSLATLATGLYPHEHGITGNDPPPGSKAAVLAGRTRMVEIFERSPAIAHLLAAKGYVSHQSGKWWEGSHASGDFTAGMTHGDPERGGRHGDDGLEIGRETMRPIFDFIASAAGKPFLLWYAPFLPHTPHNPPKRLLEPYRAKGLPIELARYYAMCEWFDETCGRLIAHLDEKGLRDNTIIVYVADNGWIQRTADMVLPSGWSQPQAPRSKRSPYEMGLRTPIILNWPGKIAPRQDRDTVASSIDIAPTLLRVAGLSPTSAMRGVDLLDAGALAGRATAYGAIFTHNAVELENAAANLQYRWCIDGRFKMIVPHYPNVPDTRAELYDILADPFETRDLLGSEPETARRMLALLDGWWAIR